VETLSSPRAAAQTPDRHLRYLCLRALLPARPRPAGCPTPAAAAAAVAEASGELSAGLLAMARGGRLPAVDVRLQSAGDSVRAAVLLDCRARRLAAAAARPSLSRAPSADLARAPSVGGGASLSRAPSSATTADAAELVFSVAPRLDSDQVRRAPRCPLCITFTLLYTLQPLVPQWGDVDCRRCFRTLGTISPSGRSCLSFFVI
jgi:hypothetical protein